MSFCICGSQSVSLSTALEFAGIVLFPEDTLPLRVLQPRFKAAVDRAMRNDEALNTLGVIHVRARPQDGQVHVASVGTTAEVRTWVWTLLWNWANWSQFSSYVLDYWSALWIILRTILVFKEFPLYFQKYGMCYCCQHSLGSWIVCQESADLNDLSHTQFILTFQFGFYLIFWCSILDVWALQTQGLLCGSLVKIRQRRHLTDGSVNVVTKGRQRFRICKAWTEADGAVQFWSLHFDSARV